MRSNRRTDEERQVLESFMEMLSLGEERARGIGVVKEKQKYRKGVIRAVSLTVTVIYHEALCMHCEHNKSLTYQILQSRKD